MPLLMHRTHLGPVGKEGRTSSFVWIGQRTFTHTHYDTQHNFYVQLAGVAAALHTHTHTAARHVALLTSAAAQDRSASSWHRRPSTRCCNSSRRRMRHLSRRGQLSLDAESASAPP
jgi:hypothetical protein